MTMKMTHENVARALLNASLNNFLDSDGKCKCCVDPTVAQKAFEMLNPVRPKDLDYDAWGHKYFCGNCNFKICREDNYCKNCGRKVDWNG